MELALSKYNALSFEITATLEISKKTFDALKLCYPKQKNTPVISDEFIVFGNDYKIAKENYTARAIIQKESNKEYRLLLIYSKGKIVGEPNVPKLQPLSKMLNCLSDITNTLTFDVDANFLYSEKKFKSRMQLPIKLTDDEHFDEVRGLRLVKLAEGKKLFSLIIDRPDNEKFYHSVKFSYVGSISDSLPGQILDEAVTISKKGLA